MFLTTLALGVSLALGPKDRVVFLGDSITDGDTYRLLVEQALVEAKKPVPILVNKGIGGDTAAKMLARLERDVFTQKPKHVFLSCGVNDVVSPDDFRASVTAIADRLKEKRIGLTLMTPEIPGGDQPEVEARHDRYEAIMRDLAKRDHLVVAEVARQMKSERQNGAILIGEDTVHPNYAGSRSIARAVLDSMGYASVPVPEVLKPRLIDGVVRHWTIRALPDGAAQELNLPLPVQSPKWWAEPNGVWWQEQERQRGFALDLNRLVGPGTVLATTSIVSPTEHNVWLTLGAAVKAVRLNGVELKLQNLFGWHAGKDRLKTTLAKGPNRLEVECDGSFFVAVEPAS